MAELTEDDLLKLRGLKALATEGIAFHQKLRSMANRVCGLPEDDYGWPTEFLDDPDHSIEWLLERLKKDAA